MVSTMTNYSTSSPLLFQAMHALWLVGLRYNNKCNGLNHKYSFRNGRRNECMSFVDISLKMTPVFNWNHWHENSLSKQTFASQAYACLGLTLFFFFVSWRRQSLKAFPEPSHLINQSITKREGLYHQFIYLIRNFWYCHVVVSYIYY